MFAGCDSSLFLCWLFIALKQVFLAVLETCIIIEERIYMSCGACISSYMPAILLTQPCTILVPRPPQCSTPSFCHLYSKRQKLDVEAWERHYSSALSVFAFISCIHCILHLETILIRVTKSHWYILYSNQ